MKEEVDVALGFVADELRPVLNRVRQAKEILGMGGIDCAYNANKVLEPVLYRLSELVQALEGERR